MALISFQQNLKDTLGHAYTFEQELRAGGMSRAFIAIDRSSRRKVVIKFLTPKLISHLNLFQFRREILAAAQLKHPHILPVISSGDHKDFVWYTMPFIAGQSLRSAVEKYVPMSVSDVLRVLQHVGEALDYAHREGVVHRGINAANVLETGAETLVTDLGVTRALINSVSGLEVGAIDETIGTRAYMAPEQLAGDSAADHRIDIYAVGVLAYELLKGRSRLAVNNASTDLVADSSQELRPLAALPPNVPQSLSELITRCLSREPDERPATARELLNALEAISISEAAAAVPAPTEPAPEPTVEPTVEPALEPMSLPPPEPTPETTSADQTPLFGLASPRRNGKKILAGGIVLILPIAAGAILLSRRSDTESSGDTVTPAAASPLIESAPLDTSPEGVITRKKVAARQRVSRARDDSIQKARAEWARLAAQKDSLRAESARRAAALADSVRRAEETKRNQVRSAAAAMLANPRAVESFMQGATHKGGLL
ncbi:MAG TPA: serine/threonine-protein kinase, partial [Gemmatimonadaceae bacterium]|nr:serine/threonine-protein kinase [Gemmatimonadaceae bacterium]